MAINHPSSHRRINRVPSSTDRAIVRVPACSRRASQAVSLFAATAVVLSSTPAFAATSIELTDKRSENQNGLQLIYEVRPLRVNRIHDAGFGFRPRSGDGDI